ncbi:hypothetical protein F2P81_017691 [Scophthalmus maximus]|uniref:EGF-like domain-containing protein n=1 Tax=Scophthalmus maximus TaxID=52904 RepID=A0A6A4SGE0_SCOMX|nr:hypothetical protein F2P81_017691 [Scophthalmus maximus]
MRRLIYEAVDVSSGISSRCFPRCHNGALCRRPDRCICRRGFRGSRCQFSAVMGSVPGRPLTSIHPTTTAAVVRRLDTRGVPERLRVHEVEMKATAEETLTQAESKPEFNDLRLQTRDGGEASVTWRVKTEDVPPRTLQTVSGSESEGESVDQQSDAAAEHLQSDPGRRSEAGETRRTEEEEVKKQQQPLSLREAQAVLLRKTLSRRGRGDKMAALLMKHIEKERKKLVSAASSSNSSSSSSVKTSGKSFHTQKGQYTVHLTTPTVVFYMFCD